MLICFCLVTIVGTVNVELLASIPNSPLGPYPQQNNLPVESTAHAWVSAKLIFFIMKSNS